MKKIMERHYVQNALDYESYRQLVDELLLQGKTTGEKQTEQLVEYTRKNVATMQLIDQTLMAHAETARLIKAVRQPQTWVVLAEGWCRDAAQVLPVLNVLAKLTPHIQLRLLLRDENLGLMDQYLTNGTSRSIPKLIAVDSESLEELFNWGAGAAIQQSKGAEKTTLIQQEIGELVTRHVHNQVLVPVS